MYVRADQTRRKDARGQRRMAVDVAGERYLTEMYLVYMKQPEIHGLNCSIPPWIFLLRFAGLLYRQSRVERKNESIMKQRQIGLYSTYHLVLQQ